MKNVAEFLRLKLSVMSAREKILNSFLITTLYKMATNKESTKLILALSMLLSTFWDKIALFVLANSFGNLKNYLNLKRRILNNS